MEEKIQELREIITLEVAQFNFLAQRYHPEVRCKPVVDPEIRIALSMPNELAKARRFYKAKPSWTSTSHPLARNNAYYKYCIDQIEVHDGLWTEFGVKFGRSANILVDIKKEKFPQSTKPLYGFDSFVGFPEDTKEWGKAGRLSKEGVAPTISGAEFYKGWFKDTIPTFVQDHPEDLALLHVDCDIYNSTVTVLEGLKNKIVPGTVILFDDILSYSQRRDIWGGEEHEYKAFSEFVEKYEVEYRWLASIPNASQAACIIEKIAKD